MEQKVKIVGTLKEFKKIKKDLKRYKEGFNVLIEYLDTLLCNKEKDKINRKLKRLGLWN